MQGYDTVVVRSIDFADVQLEKNGDDCQRYFKWSFY